MPPRAAVPTTPHRLTALSVAALPIRAARYEVRDAARHRTVVYLFPAARWFRCRVCLRLGYLSELGGRTGRADRACVKAARKRGADYFGDVAGGWLPRPTGVRRATYAGHLTRLKGANARRDTLSLEGAARTLARFPARHLRPMERARRLARQGGQGRRRATPRGRTQPVRAVARSPGRSRCSRARDGARRQRTAPLVLACLAPRYYARTHAGALCQAPACRGRRRCRLYGGRSLEGTAHPSYVHGQATRAARRERAALAALVRACHRTLGELGAG